MWYQLFQAYAHFNFAAFFEQLICGVQAVFGVGKGLQRCASGVQAKKCRRKKDLRERKSLILLPNAIERMVGREGFEPSTNWLKANCSTD